MAQQEKTFTMVPQGFFSSDMWIGEKFTKGQAWVDMLQMASYSTREVWVGRRRITLLPGQLILGEREAHRRWGWHRQTVRSFFEQLSYSPTVPGIVPEEEPDAIPDTVPLIAMVREGRYTVITVLSGWIPPRATHGDRTSQHANHRTAERTGDRTADRPVADQLPTSCRPVLKRIRRDEDTEEKRDVRCETGDETAPPSTPGTHTDTHTQPDGALALGAPSPDWQADRYAQALRALRPEYARIPDAAVLHALSAERDPGYRAQAFADCMAVLAGDLEPENPIKLLAAYMRNARRKGAGGGNGRSVFGLSATEREMVVDEG